METRFTNAAVSQSLVHGTSFSRSSFFFEDIFASGFPLPHHSSMEFCTKEVIFVAPAFLSGCCRRISSALVVFFGTASIVFRTQAVHSLCCLQPSFRELVVRLLTYSTSAVVLAPAFCFVCCRALASLSLSLSAASFAACLNCGISAFRFYGFLRCNRPGFFSGLVLLNCLLYLKRFFDSLHLVFQLGSFLFLCGFPRLLFRSNLAPL